MLTQKELKEILCYNENTGVFTWKTQPSKHVREGDVAGCLNHAGYRVIKINKKIYRACRLVWLCVYGFFPENYIDHINRKKSDDRVENLREVSVTCNLRNRGKMRSNSSGVTGVHYNKERKHYRATIMVDKKAISLGYHETKREAANARHKAEIYYNFPNCSTTSSALEYLNESQEK